MKFTPVKTPGLFKHVFSNLVWTIPSNNKVLYLTFDDGPTPEVTTWVLKTLKQYNAKATFFCIGKNVKKHPDIFKAITNEGHVTGNHTYSHVKGWTTADTLYLKDVEQASKVISSKLFRPPYGQIKPSQAKKLNDLGYKIIMWNILSVDWSASVTLNKCANNVIKNSSSGDIVVFHDSLKAKNNMQYALPKVLDYFSAKEYEFRGILEQDL